MAFEILKKDIVGKVHFIGIGGIGMSALALLLNKVGIGVQGSDINQTYVTEKLQKNNIEVFFAQEGGNITKDVGLVVKTSIIRDNNPEVIAAEESGIKIITRAELLAHIMHEKTPITAAGTHGKTSTTALISAIFIAADLEPTVINGGFINSLKSNFILGDGEYLIAESDESDGSFVDLPSYAGVVTNIEPEHLDFYGNDFNLQKSYFEKYISQIPKEGVCAVNAQDQNIQKICSKIEEKNIVTYSIDNNVDADFMAQNIKFSNQGTSFDVSFQGQDFAKNIFLPAFGAHNVSNSLAAIAVAHHCKISAQQVKSGLAQYQGVKRRFTKVGEYNGCVIIDDYAHHPTEIKAAVSCAKQYADQGQVALVIQPHKYSRVRDLFDEFCESVTGTDKVFLLDIYSANQGKIAGISKELLFKQMSKIHPDVVMLNNDNDLAKEVKDFAKKDNIILCVGAGTVTKYASNLEKELQLL
mgnify:CR=1 FL=1